MASQSRNTCSKRTGILRSQGRRPALWQKRVGTAPQERVQFCCLWKRQFSGASGTSISVLGGEGGQSQTYALTYLSCILKLCHFFLYKADHNKLKKKDARKNWTLYGGTHLQIPTLKNLRQEDCHKFKACLEYIVRP